MGLRVVEGSLPGLDEASAMRHLRSKSEVALESWKKLYTDARQHLNVDWFLLTPPRRDLEILSTRPLEQNPQHFFWGFVKNVCTPWYGWGVYVQFDMSTPLFISLANVS